METRSSFLFYHILFVSCVVLLAIGSAPVAFADQTGDQPGDHEIGRGMTGSGQTFNYVNDEIIVRYRSELYNNTLLYQPLSAEIARQINGSIIEDYGSMGLPGMQLIALSNGTTADRAIAYYRNISYIDYAQYNYVETLSEPQPSDPGTSQQSMGMLSSGKLMNYPNDPLYPRQWYLGTIDAPDAWSITTGSPDIEIAVLDSGIEIDHQDLANNIDRKNSTSTVSMYHGTECAGIIAASGNNGIGISGVMWRAKLVPVVVANTKGNVLTSYVISGISRARQYGAKIISCSFGFTYNDLAMQDAFANSNALAICAAGNSGDNNDVDPMYPASYNYNTIISVAASDENDNLADFSNYGANSVDLAAPGKNIYSTFTGNQYNFDDGTSFSAPMVTGVAGLIMAKHPELSNAQVKAAILNNVDKVPSLKGKVVTGGRLNAYKALKSLEQVPVPTKTIAPPPVTTIVPVTTVTTVPITTVPPTTTVPVTVVTTIPVPTKTPVPKVSPVPSFTASITQGGAPLTVTFTDQSANYPSRWIWDFGDGVTSTDRNPVHTYGKTGLYNVRLSVYNAIGGNGLTKWNYISVSGSAAPAPTTTSTVSPTITQTVSPTPTKTVVPTTTVTTVPVTTVPTAVVTTPVPTNTPVPKTTPVSSFTASVTQGGAPLTVTFTDQSSNYPSRWMWDFGDGATSTDRNPVHTYAKPGSYNVRLSVYNAIGGNGLTKWNYISVSGSASQTPITTPTMTPIVTQTISPTQTIRPTTVITTVSPTTTPTGQIPLIHLSGSGEQVTSKFTLQKGLSIFRMTHSNDVFGAFLLDENGSVLKFLGSGPSDAEGIDNPGQYSVKTITSGNWNIEIEQPRGVSANPVSHISGTGSTATQFFYLNHGLNTFRFTNDGPVFGAFLMDSSGNVVDVLVTNSNPSGTSDAENIEFSGVYLIDVVALGNWTISMN